MTSAEADALRSLVKKTWARLVRKSTAVFSREFAKAMKSFIHGLTKGQKDHAVLQSVISRHSIMRTTVVKFKSSQSLEIYMLHL